MTRPGGRLVVCEFSAITIAPADMLYRRYLLHVLPAIARRAARNPEAYEYLAESIVDWPTQRETGVTDQDGLLVGGAMAEPEPGRGGRARRPPRLTGGTDPGTLDPGARCPGVRLAG